jgi:hypothetical protein
MESGAAEMLWYLGVSKTISTSTVTIFYFPFENGTPHLTMPLLDEHNCFSQNFATLKWGAILDFDLKSFCLQSFFFRGFGY